MLKLRSNLSYSTQGMFLIPLVLQNSGNSEKTEENISNATSTKYSPFFPPVSVENNNRDPTKTNFHESHPSWLFLPWYSPPKRVKKSFAIGLFTNVGRNPFKRNFQAVVRKFLGVKWIATGPNGLVPFHSQNEFRARLKWRMLDHCCSC